jgi:NTP pyrophosphatase (non-canonical NTP hydrolase)
MTNPATDPVPDAPLRDELRAWADGIIRAPGMVAPADVRRAVLDILERYAAPVPVKDTDTPDCKCGNPSNPGVDHKPHGSNGFGAVSSTVDSSARERIAWALAEHSELGDAYSTDPDVYLLPRGGGSYETIPAIADVVLAALPELAENKKLRAELEQLKAENMSLRYDGRLADARVDELEAKVQELNGQPSRPHITDETAIYPEAGEGTYTALSYVALGLAGEAGEVANQVKKIARDDSGTVNPEREAKLLSELGDVWWYWMRVCVELGANPQSVIAMNLSKLAQRKETGTLHGDGEQRMPNRHVHIGARVQTPKGFGYVIAPVDPAFKNIVNVQLDPKPGDGETWEFNVNHVKVIVP